MIGAPLSNAPANLLRGSGVVGEPEPGPGDKSSGRDGVGVGDSKASSRQVAVRVGAVPVLTPEAVLALQETDPSETSGGRRLNETEETDDAQSEAGGDEDGQTAGTNEIRGGAGQGAAGVQDGQDGSGKDEEDPDGDGLNEAEEKQVKELAKRDREVRAHEQAHARVGGAYASAPSYTFQQGPDGKRYAVGGEVQIDTAKERTPEATIRKMQIVIRAATAPAEPSSQDLKVAQQARSQLTEAQTELRQQKAEELKGGDEDSTGPATGETDKAPSAREEAQPPEGDVGETDSETIFGSSDDDGDTEDTNRSDAISAYTGAVQRVIEAQSLFNAVIG